MNWKADLFSVTDGDTCRLHLSATHRITPGWLTTVSSDNPRGQAIRLTILDTPERGEPGYYEAKDNLAYWLGVHKDCTMVETYDSGGFDRLLGDVYCAYDRGDTATQYMLGLGWGVYIK